MSSINKNIAGKKVSAEKGLKIGIVLSQYNAEIGEALFKRCVKTLTDSGVSVKNILTVKVPGAFELPYVCQKLATQGRYDVIIALGVIIKGGTPHFNYIASSCAKGIMNVSLKTDVPIIFGVLTTNNIAQAKARIDKGAEAALTALRISNLNL